MSKTLTKHSSIPYIKFRLKPNLCAPITVKSANVKIHNTDITNSNNKDISINVSSRPDTVWGAFYVLESYAYFANKKN